LKNNLSEEKFFGFYENPFFAKIKLETSRKNIFSKNKFFKNQNFPPRLKIGVAYRLAYAPQLVSNFIDEFYGSIFYCLIIDSRNVLKRITFSIGKQVKESFSHHIFSRELIG
jgi:hypothetical protein